LKATSFNGSAAASALSITERNTQFLTRDIMRNFDFDSASSYSLNAGSLKAYESTGTPGEDIKGKMLSSSIISLFGA
ncbi:MAG: hypothetical protein H6R31_523, partial [Methanomicrobia archaeon]|nr:hypothetical protein [Methanomicrobia archaeon]